LVAMVEDRPYRPGMSLDKAVEVLRRDAQDGKLPSEVVETAAKMIKSGFYPLVERGISEQILEELEHELFDQSDGSQVSSS